MAGSIPVLTGLSNITNYDKCAEGNAGAAEAGAGRRRTGPLEPAAEGQATAWPPPAEPAPG